MTIHIAKFGTVLTSRQSGKEAYAAFLPTLASVSAQEDILVDFTDVSAFSPSWGDEFLTPLQRTYRDRLTFMRTDNPSVILTLSLLERMNSYTFHQQGIARSQEV